MPFGRRRSCFADAGLLADLRGHESADRTALLSGPADVGVRMTLPAPRDVKGSPLARGPPVNGRTTEVPDEAVASIDDVSARD